MPTMWKLPLLALFAGVSIFAQTLRYSVLLNGVSAGAEVDTYSPDGRVTSTFEYNDRGRGPKVSSAYSLAPDGLPRLTGINGVDYLKSPVNEQFSAENGKAEWKSTSEQGHATTSGFYVSMNGPVAENAFLVNALL